jgi:hypothetical protein
MKYAFVIGSNAFIVPRGAISYGDHDFGKEFLKINSIYHDLSSSAEKSFLEIDLDIKDTDGGPVTVLANKPVNGVPITVNKERDSVKVFRADGSLIIHVHQLDDDSAMSLEHNITAELEVHAPIAVIRITGEFIVDNLHIIAENEKLYINDNGYATSALAGKNRLKFTSAGVVL